MRHLMGLVASLNRAPCVHQLRLKYFLLIWVNQKETLCRTLRTRLGTGHWGGVAEERLLSGERNAQRGEWMAL